MIGIPYFAYMISVIAELINNVITWAKSRITGISITGLYITGGTIFMIVIPAKIFVVVEGGTMKISKKKTYFFFQKKFRLAIIGRNVFYSDFTDNHWFRRSDAQVLILFPTGSALF